MSASASESKQQSSSTQVSTQGASGENSPTLSAGGGINFTSNDPKIALTAIGAAGDAIKAVLNNLNSVQTQVAQQGAQQQSNNSDLISQVLQNQATLAAAKVTDGASLKTDTNNKVIYGAVAIAIAAIIALIFSRKSA